VVAEPPFLKSPRREKDVREREREKGSCGTSRCAPPTIDRDIQNVKRNYKKSAARAFRVTEFPP